MGRFARSTDGFFHAVRDFSPNNSTRIYQLFKAPPLQRMSEKQLLQLHDAVLFGLAYPHNPWMIQRFPMLLGKVSREVARRVKRQPRFLIDSGVAFTESRCEFGFSSVRWLLERFSKDVDFVWDDDGELNPEVTDLILESAPRLEADGVLAPDHSLRQIFHRMGGRAALSFMNLIGAADVAPAIADRIFRSLKVEVRWRHGSEVGSRTAARLKADKIFIHAESIRPQGDLRATIKAASIRRRRLGRSESVELMDVARVALLVRGRETDPVCDGDPEGAQWYQCGRGVSVALFCARPDRRRPVESYIGYVAFKNGVPVAYGGAWILGATAEIGVNIFQEYRGGESLYLFAQILAVYHQKLGVNHFFVDPYQFGDDNEEGLQSGAFWFYYRCGFRPIRPSLSRLAATEFRRSVAGGHRSSRAVLRRLCGGALRMSLVRDAARKIDIASLALRVCDGIRQFGGGDVLRAESGALKELIKILPRFRSRHWSTSEYRAFARLALVVLSIDDPRMWTTSEQRALIPTLRAKGSPAEYRYVAMVQHHQRLLAALHRAGARSPRNRA